MNTDRAFDKDFGTKNHVVEKENIQNPEAEENYRFQGKNKKEDFGPTDDKNTLSKNNSSYSDGKWGLSSFALKIIAMVSMCFDHIGIAFLSGNLYIVFRAIGRLAFPIYCFILVEGFFHTRSRVKYAARLFIFALISEVPYDCFHRSFFNPDAQNILFLLFIGYMLIWFIDASMNNRVKYPAFILRWFKNGIQGFTTVLDVWAVLLAMWLVHAMHISYSYAGIILILCFYFAKESQIGKAFSNLFFNVVFFKFSVQWIGVLSIVPIAAYNGKPGTKRFKYLFYVFYPVHLLIIAVIEYILTH